MTRKGPGWPRWAGWDGFVEALAPERTASWRWTRISRTNSRHIPELLAAVKDCDMVGLGVRGRRG